MLGDLILMQTICYILLGGKGDAFNKLCAKSALWAGHFWLATFSCYYEHINVPGESVQLFALFLNQAPCFFLACAAEQAPLMGDAEVCSCKCFRADPTVRAGGSCSPAQRLTAAACRFCVFLPVLVVLFLPFLVGCGFGGKSIFLWQCLHCCFQLGEENAHEDH